MKWESPWGTGYPGWHIECSAMAMKYLGETFDIHCGGNDHIPVHNTNEIAQSECATGKTFARYWMHAAFLNVKGKMSKSKGNFLTVQTLKNSGYDPLAYRYLCLQAHYRSELELAWEWSDDARTKGQADSLDTAAASLKRLYERVARTSDEPLADQTAFDATVTDVLTALCDDLNIPKAIGVLHSYGSPRLWRHFDAVLGLDFETHAVQPAEVSVPADVLSLVDERQAARKAKDFARSDAIRAELLAMGWEVGDSPQGPTIKPVG
jgi:cysteinyl-tRNA synthetase